MAAFLLHMTHTNLIQHLERLFEEKQNLEKAIANSKYVRNLFTYYGVCASQRKEIQKQWLSEHGEALVKVNKWHLLREMWTNERREVHYVAIDWLNSWKKSAIQEQDIEHLEWLLVNQSWWDSVDAIASNYLGEYFKKFPVMKGERIERWKYSNNKWLHRSCLIFQLKYRGELDFEILKSLIQYFQPSKEFFIQKAIGWSLRQHSKFDPNSVAAFIDEMRLQGLARREASKYLH
jgi:3-methyladenine DNA glycosylase AlkD